jgi:nitrogenase-stabilizing/protective protein
MDRIMRGYGSGIEQNILRPTVAAGASAGLFRLCGERFNGPRKTLRSQGFLSYLNAGYDPALAQVARLHILRRMGKYLADKDFSGASEGAIFAQARETLFQACQDFAASRPIDEQEHDPSRPALPAEPALKPFVPPVSSTIIGPYRAPGAG